MECEQNQNIQAKIFPFPLTTIVLTEPQMKINYK